MLHSKRKIHWDTGQQFEKFVQFHEKVAGVPEALRSQETRKSSHLKNVFFSSEYC